MSEKTTYSHNIGDRSYVENDIVFPERIENVYAAFDSHGVVTSIESDSTKSNFGTSTNYVCIDKGSTNKHVHAQTIYLRTLGYGYSGGLWSNSCIIKDDRYFEGTDIYKWRIKHGKLVERDPEEFEIVNRIEHNRIKIVDLKKKLSDTDYVAAKIAEGAATSEEYASTLADRQGWRDEINQIEAVIAEDETRYSAFDTDPYPINNESNTEEVTDNG